MADDQDNTTDNVPSEALGNAEAQPVSVGTVLREARERQGLSVDEVVSRIKFAPRQIAALEADDFAQLPEIAFVRGFVRSYARLLQLDSAPLLAALPHAPAQTVLAAAENALPEVPFPTDYSSRKPNIIWLAAALVVAVALALFMLLNGSGSNAPSPPVEPQVKVETLELTSVEVLPDSAVLPVSPSGVSAVPAQASVTPASSVAAVISPEVKASVELSAPSLRIDHSAVQAMQKKPEAVPGSAGAIRMTFDDDSWVEVTDKDGKILLSQINPRGSEQNLDGKAPFSLVIGRATAVRLYYKGKQIDLVPHTKISTARVTLE